MRIWDILGRAVWLNVWWRILRYINDYRIAHLSSNNEEQNMLAYCIGIEGYQAAP